MQDLILTKLGDISDLKVISRPSTMKYPSHPDDLKSVSLQLGVATVLEGSVQKSGDQVLINVQLINARSDIPIWAQSYQRTLKNVFGVEGEVAEKIADALKAKLSLAETKQLATALSDDPAANDHYLQAEYYVNRALTTYDARQVLKQAFPLYRKAIARAPNFALAHAGLSFAESLFVTRFPATKDNKTLTVDAGAQAEQAMKLAPGLPESNLAMGVYEFEVKWDLDAARKAFDTALKIRPNYALAMSWHGILLLSLGKFDEAIASFKHALTLDPRNSSYAYALAQSYMIISRYDMADEAFQQAIALNPDVSGYRIGYAKSILFGTGDTNRALNALHGNSLNLKQQRAEMLIYQRKFDSAIALEESLPSASCKGGSNGSSILGGLYRYSGDTARAMACYAMVLPTYRALLNKVAYYPAAAAWTWSIIAEAELGLGKTEAGLAAIKAQLAVSARSPQLVARINSLSAAALRYAQAGRADEAVSLISRALATVGGGSEYSPVMLWLDPGWDPIRKTPAFQALLKKYAKFQPSTVPAEVKD